MRTCVSYKATLRLMGEVGDMHTIHLQKWFDDGEVFKFLRDNVATLQKYMFYSQTSRERCCKCAVCTIAIQHRSNVKGV